VNKYFPVFLIGTADSIYDEDFNKSVFFLKGFLHDGVELNKLHCICLVRERHFKVKAEEIPEDKSMRKVIKTEKAPEPVGPYSQALKVGGFLFVSGQVAIDPEKGGLVAGGIRAQTARVMENIQAVLQAASYNLGDVVQSNVYLSSMALFREFNDEYSKYFDKGFPARATVGIELMRGALVEISVIAYKD
jgi:2-iminobutanoate/2-iminopropanoate deaminase